MKATGRWGVLFSSYWTGPTGREIQMRGAHATILGLYLLSTNHANMIGLYHLPLAYIAADLPVLAGSANIQRALADLSEVGFAHYDERAEMVWVCELARIGCWLAPGQKLDVSDKRRAAIINLYRSAPPCSLLESFHERYTAQLGLPECRANTLARPLEAPFRQGPSEPLGRPSEVRSDQIREQGSDQGTDQIREQGTDQIRSNSPASVVQQAHPRSNVELKRDEFLGIHQGHGRANHHFQATGHRAKS